jgi:hypothetical protein
MFFIFEFSVERQADQQMFDQRFEAGARVAAARPKKAAARRPSRILCGECDPQSNVNYSASRAQSNGSCRLQCRRSLRRGRPEELPVFIDDRNLGTQIEITFDFRSGTPPGKDPAVRQLQDVTVAPNPSRLRGVSAARH